MLTPTVKMPCWVHCRGVTVCRLLSVGFLSWLPAISLPLVLLAGGDVTPSLSSILLSILNFCPFSDIVGKEPLFDVSWSSTHLSCLDCCPWMTSRVAPYVATDCNSAVAPFDRTLSSLLWASSPSPLSWPSFPSPQLQIGEMSEKSLAPNSISTVSLTDLSSFEDGMHLTLSWIALGSQNL